MHAHWPRSRDAEASRTDMLGCTPRRAGRTAEEARAAAATLIVSRTAWAWASPPCYAMGDSRHAPARSASLLTPAAQKLRPVYAAAGQRLILYGHKPMNNTLRARFHFRFAIYQPPHLMT